MTDLPAVRVDGHAYSYEDVPGDTGRAPLLFLHEGLGSVGLWRGFHHRVAAATGRRAVAFSRLGHGWSDPPPAPRAVDFMDGEAADVVPAVCAALGLEHPVLVGHSDGGTIALLHAGATTPGHDVPGIVVLAPHTFAEPSGLREIEATRRAYENGLRERMARHHRDPDVVFRNWNDVWLHPDFRSWDIRPRLAGITCPVLAVQGTADLYGTVAHVESVREHARGPVELALLDCGHSPHLERREETEALVARFVDTLP